jgi:hypothetical protein
MNLLDILRDQAWQGIAAIITVISLLLTIVLEWPRFERRRKRSRSIQNGLEENQLDRDSTLTNIKVVFTAYPGIVPKDLAARLKEIAILSFK